MLLTCVLFYDTLRLGFLTRGGVTIFTLSLFPNLMISTLFYFLSIILLTLAKDSKLFFFLNYFGPVSPSCICIRGSCIADLFRLCNTCFKLTLLTELLRFSHSAIEGGALRRVNYLFII